MATEEEQYRAAREGCAMWRRSGRAAFEVRGGEALDFLQRMVTQDLRGVEVGEGRAACLTDRMGKVLGAFTLRRLGDRYLATCDEACADTLLQKLTMYVLGADVTLEDARERWGSLLVVGPRAGELLEPVAGALPPEGPLACVEVGERVVARDPALGAEGFEVLAPPASLDPLLEELAMAGIVPLADGVARVLRVEAGTPVYGVDFDADALPTEAGLGHTVNYHKGCYMGQEILERMRSRGVRTKELLGVELGDGGLPEAGAAELEKDGKGVATLTSPVVSPASGRVLGLAMVPVKKAEVGDTLSLGGVPARLRKLPMTGEDEAHD